MGITAEKRLIVNMGFGVHTNFINNYGVAKWNQSQLKKHHAHM